MTKALSLVFAVLALRTLTIGVRAASIALGDSVFFTATARNNTAARVKIGVACGPSLDVLVITPDGARRSALQDGTNGGAFDCPLLPSHYLEAGETQVMMLGWIAPATRGSYRAAAGLRRSDGLSNLSTQVVFTVR